MYKFFTSFLFRPTRVDQGFFLKKTFCAKKKKKKTDRQKKDLNMFLLVLARDQKDHKHHKNTNYPLKKNKPACTVN